MKSEFRSPSKFHPVSFSFTKSQAILKKTIVLKEQIKIKAGTPSEMTASIAYHL